MDDFDGTVFGPPNPCMGNLIRVQWYTEIFGEHVDNAPNPLGGSASPEPEDLDESLIALWSEYSKDRYLATEDQIKEFRNWARQLGAVVTVLLGLEMTVIVKVLFDIKEKFIGWHAAGLALLLIAIATQVVMLTGNILTGYTGEPVLGPESPLVLRYNMNSLSARARSEIFGRYYANGYAENHKLQQKLGGRLKGLSKALLVSLTLFVLGIVAIIVDASRYQVSSTGGAAGNSVALCQPRPSSRVQPGTASQRIKPLSKATTPAQRQP